MNELKKEAAFLRYMTDSMRETKDDNFTRTETIHFGNHGVFPVEFTTSRQLDLIDTEVKFKGSFWLTWDDREEFLKDFKKLIEKYFI